MKKNVLFKRGVLITFLLMAFFCINKNVFASSFAYSAFDWDTFLEQHKSYWVSGCENGDTDCVDRVLKTKEKFYKRLYSLLATYQNRGYFINDNIIIETVFFGLTPDSFADEGTIPDEYEGQVHNYGYAIDESESSSKYIASDDGELERAREYFKKEADSLKTLMNNMIGYTRACYGVSDETPHTVTNDNGSTSLVCSGDYVPLNGKCVQNVATLKSSFFEMLGISIFSSNNNEQECMEKTKGYSSYMLGDVSEKQVNEELYWDFLKNDDYFDKKVHLQSYFETVLKQTNHKTMSELTQEEYEEYKDLIIASRERIINNIQSIIEDYGTFATTPAGSFISSCNNDVYWWPIGGSDVTSSGAIELAIGMPVSTRISSGFVVRIRPNYGTVQHHKGIDIAAAGGSNVIAAKNGTVIYPKAGDTGNCVEGNKSCGGSFGNYVIIQHEDGNYTVYAHMQTHSLRVQAGDSVVQGQVIGKVGSTGNSTGNHLHFEVRVGGSSSANAQQPLNFVSAETPRPTSSTSTCGVGGGNLFDFIYSWEGAPKEDGDYYIAFDDGAHNVTIGVGIAVKYNKERFRQLGVNPDSITYGSKVKKEIVDEIFKMEIQDNVNYVKSTLANAGISLENYQIDALVSRTFNTGNIKNFPKAYKQYGNTNALYTNYMSTPVKANNGQYMDGLRRRREAEWELFSKGNYKLNS